MHTHRRLRTFLLASAAVALGGAPALAQPEPPAAEPAPPPAVGAEAAPPPVTPPAAPPPAAGGIVPAPAPFKFESPGGSSLKVGLLLQPRFQMAGSNTLDSNSYNLYIRRTRVLLGGELFGVIDYFFETDYANLNLASSETGIKSTPGMNIQDAFATAHPFGNAVKLDVGYMLPPLAHNAIQGAGTLLSWDYFANSFNSTASTAMGSSGNPVGRDTGVQLRGLVLDGRLEYRAGLFQGFRNPASMTDVGSRNFFRFAGRLQVNLLDPETGFFYAGTYLGKKRILSLGGSIDLQDAYHYYAGDLFADLPVGPDGVFTAQVNFNHMSAGSFIPLHKQEAIMAEVGYTFLGLGISPILRFEEVWDQSLSPSAHQAAYSGGLAWWPYGFASNVKLFYSQVRVSGEAHAANQVILQWQLYFF
jgi:hypothetical protein